MAFALSLNFNTTINTSTQVGDIIYYTPVGITGLSSTAYNTGSSTSTIELGKVTDIINPDLASGDISTITVLCDLYDDNGNPITPQPNDFIIFGKDKTANTTSLIGYYMEIKFVNNSRDKVELFSVGSQVVESSK
tara:strand:- start:267 stop:671 length:405 start_codon:yes stop_codon:yes gene_type:complete